MTRQELYSWSSLVSSAILLMFYLIAVFGWPSAIEQYSEYVLGLFWKVLVIAVIIEVGLEIIRELDTGRPEEGEEHALIEGKGYKNAYYFLTGTMVAVAVTLFFSDFTSLMSGEEVFLTVPFTMLHIIVAVIFVASMTKSVTSLYYYRKAKAEISF